MSGRRVTFAAFPWRWVSGDGCIVRLVAIVDPMGSYRLETGLPDQNGKAFLASMSPQDLARATAGPLPRLTSHTITGPGALLEELDQVRVEGVAYDREENSEGICAVGMILAGLPGPARPAVRG